MSPKAHWQVNMSFLTILCLIWQLSDNCSYCLTIRFVLSNIQNNSQFVGRTTINSENSDNIVLCAKITINYNSTGRTVRKKEVFNMSNANINEIVLANGTMESVDGIVATIELVDGIDAQIVEVMNNCTASLITEYSNVTKGYFNMVSSVAIMLHNKFFKNIKGCKTINQYLLENIKCSKSTASELVKVASTYYNSKGKLENNDFGVFTYSELVKLATQPEDIRKEVAEVIKCLPEHTRADVLKATDKVICKNILNDTNKKIEEIAEEIQSEKTENKTEKTKVSENKPATPNTINYKNLYEDIYKKLSAIDTKTATKADIVKTIEEITFIMVTNLE